MLSDAQNTLEYILEAALFAADKPLSVEKLRDLFEENAQPSAQEIQQALQALQQRYDKGGVELIKVASGYRFQTRAEWAPWVQKLWEEKPPRLSRAVLETLALMAYRQPITRGEIEEIRGVAVSSQIVRTLVERGWVRVVGHKEVPGRPALYATTNEFLDYFNLSSLEDLPTLAELEAITLAEESEKQAAEAAAAEQKAKNAQHSDVNHANIETSDALDPLDDLDMEAVDSVLKEFDQRFKANQSFQPEDEQEARSANSSLEPQEND